MSSQQSIAFFGATGGAAKAALVSSLNAGAQCRTLASSRQQLLESLTDEGVSEKHLQNLTVIPGLSTNPREVAQTLQQEDGSLSSTIIFGVGVAPSTEPGMIHEAPVSSDGVNTVVSVIKTLPYTSHPKICVTSTTSLSPPNSHWLLAPFTNWQQQISHSEKRKMKNAIVKAAEDGTIENVSIVMAKNGKSGEDKVKLAALEYGKNQESSVRSAKAVCDMIEKKDVGGWIFNNLVEGGDGAWNVFKGGKKVVLTH